MVNVWGKLRMEIKGGKGLRMGGLVQVRKIFEILKI
jgi:hypothetical protein